MKDEARTVLDEENDTDYSSAIKKFKEKISPNLEVLEKADLQKTLLKIKNLLELAQ